jgi:hypothetical protein
VSHGVGDLEPVLPGGAHPRRLFGWGTRSS